MDRKNDRIDRGAAVAPGRRRRRGDAPRGVSTVGGRRGYLIEDGVDALVHSFVDEIVDPAFVQLAPLVT